MSYELTELLELRKPVKGTGQQYDSDVYSQDLDKIDGAIKDHETRLSNLEGGDAGITVADITDASAVGKAVLKASNASTALTELGGTTTGKSIFTAADAAAARDVIGGEVGKAVMAAATVTEAREALRIFVRTTPGTPQAGDVRTRDA